jgi:hypothetical protein
MARVHHSRTTAMSCVASTRISAPVTSRASRSRAFAMKSASPARNHSSISSTSGSIIVAMAKESRTCMPAE